MTKNLSPNLDIARQFLQLISSGWNEVGDDLSMELRALGNRSLSLRFNPEKEEEVAATLESAVQLNASGSNIHITVNPAGPFTPAARSLISIIFVLAQNSLEIFASSFRFKILSFVYLPCLVFAFAIIASPASVLGPVLAPP